MAIPRGNNARGQVRIPVEIVGDREAGNKLRRIRRDMGNFRSDIKNSTDGLKQQAVAAKDSRDRIGELGTGVKSAAVAFAAVTAGVAGAIRALQSVARVARQLADRGGGFAAVAGYYERMASPDLLARMQQLSGFHIRQLDLMRGYNQAMDVGNVNQEQFTEWLQRTVAFAQARGRDVTQTWEQVQQVLSGGGMETLRELGVNVSRVQDAVRRQGLSMESSAGKTMALNLALEDLRDRQGEVDNSATNLSDAFQALNTQTDDYIDNLLRVVAESPALVGVFESVRRSIFQTGESAKDTGSFIAEMARSVIVSVSTLYRDMLLSLMNFNQAVVGVINSILSDGAFARLVSIIPGGGDLAQLLLSLRDVSRNAAENTRRWAGMVDDIRHHALADPVTAGGAMAGRSVNRGRAGDPGAEARATAEAERAAQEELRERTRLMESYIEMVRAWNEEQIRLVSEEKDMRLEAMQAEIEMARRRYEVEAEALENFKDLQREAQEAAQERTDSMIAGTTQMVTGVAGIMRTVSSALAQNADSTEEAAKAEGKFLIAYNSVMAAVSLAESIRSFVKQDYAAGAGHLIAMAGYIAAAALAGSQLGGGTASPPAARTYKPAEEQPAPPSDGGGAETQVINMNLGRVHGELGQQLMQADWEMERSGLRRPGVRGVRFG